MDENKENLISLDDVPSKEKKGKESIFSKLIKKKPAKDKTISKDADIDGNDIAKNKKTDSKKSDKEADKKKAKPVKPVNKNSASYKLKRAGHILKHRTEKKINKFRIKQNRKKREHAQLKRKLSMKEYAEYRIYEVINGEWKLLLGYLVGLLLIILLCYGCVKGISSIISHLPKTVETESETETETETEKIYPVADITIGTTGSMLLHSPFIDHYGEYNEETYNLEYDFSSVYKYIKSYYSKPDFMTCEFEGALGGEFYGYSGYPLFISPDIIIHNIKDAGVDLQFLATNHIYDGNSISFARTMDVYDDAGIQYTGIRKDVNKDPFYIADIKGVKVGFINYTYETGDAMKAINGIPMAQADFDLINTFNYSKLDFFYNEMKKNIKAMREKGAQFIIAQLHWGTEYRLEPDNYQIEMAQALCDMGVDALIGGHPHCEEPIDVITSNNSSHHKMFVVYSEGNALSNQRKELMYEEMPEGHTEDGCMITLSLHQDSHGVVDITNIELLPTWVYRYFDQDGATRYFILPLDNVDKIEETTGIRGIYEVCEDSYKRTMEVMEPGLDKALKAFYHIPEPETEPETETETETEKPKFLGIF